MFSEQDGGHEASVVLLILGVGLMRSDHIDGTAFMSGVFVVAVTIPSRDVQSRKAFVGANLHKRVMRQQSRVELISSTPQFAHVRLKRRTV